MIGVLEAMSKNPTFNEIFHGKWEEKQRLEIENKSFNESNNGGLGFGEENEKENDIDLRFRDENEKENDGDMRFGEGWECR